ncbi:MAG: GNAT family N-acetyltransferase [Erysipelotrichales bacterium]|nr:GNAT family N-acetyltransferase [Erysipelotrichales bacterium]
MFRVMKALEEDVARIKLFLNSIEAVKTIDEVVLLNASIILDDEESIVGVISFEQFSKNGLIRYFIFKKYIQDDIIRELFESMVETAKEYNLESLFTIIVDHDVSTLFVELGFEEVNKEKFFIEEDNILNTKYRDSKIMLMPV